MTAPNHDAASRTGLVDTSGPTALVTVQSEDGSYYARIYVREDGSLYLKPLIEEGHRGRT